MNDVPTSVSVPSAAQDALKSGLRGERASYGISPTVLNPLLGPKRRMIVRASLVLADLVAAVSAINLSNLLIHHGAVTQQGGALLPTAGIIAVYLCLGLYVGSGPSPCERLRLRAIGVLAFVTINFLAQFTAELNVTALAAGIFSGVFLFLLGYYSEEAVRNLLIQWKLWGATAVLVGCDERNRELAEKLIAEPQLGLRPIGFLSLCDVQGADQLPLPLLGSTKDFGRVGEYVEVGIFPSREQLALEEIVQGRHPFAQVFAIEDSHDLQTLWLRTRGLGGAVGIEIRRDLYVPHNLWLKRAVDVLVAMPVGLMALPLIAALGLIIKAVDPGPAFYAQRRVGWHGRPIRVLKLRTMYQDAERRLEHHLRQNLSAQAEWQRYFKLTDDPRILPVVGRFLRRASLDELPQLWNVIRGDMTLVGPRPFPPYHISAFDRQFQVVRQSVPPGLTGLWQISSRSDGDLQLQRAQDMFYIRNWSIWLDLYILLQTLPAVIRPKGAR
jgi:Undecaprenyl-phosphate galactose phosphotransferase WbaP